MNWLFRHDGDKSVSGVGHIPKATAWSAKVKIDQADHFVVMENAVIRREIVVANYGSPAIFVDEGVRNLEEFKASERGRDILPRVL